MIYDIGGIYIDIISEEGANLDILELFKSGLDRKPDSLIHINACNRINIEEKEVLLDDCYKWYRGIDGGTVIYIPYISGEIICKIKSDNKWENVTILYKKSINGIETAIAEHFCYSVFRIVILFHQGIFLHASSFAWGEKGIAITAPSGTGKSTHTALWEKYYGAAVINDDCPAIRMIEGKPVLIGNPWSGSSKKFMCANVPLTEIIIIKQAPENNIRKLDKKEAVERILPRFILPYYDNELLMTAAEIVDKIIDKTPVYLLSCRPEKAAAEIVAAEICK